ncbi:MAG TPA: helix-turn-helix transcriptional regulator [Thermoanaerobaculia bacterium]|nr:helix-turn-helix transcriptional regulator [Thermoanaerobaculia bacterium]
MFEHLGDALALLRRLRRMSQTDLARAAQVGRSQLSRYENGLQLPHLGQLERLLESLNATMADLAAVLAFLRRLESGEAREGLDSQDLLALMGSEGLIPTPVQDALAEVTAQHLRLCGAVREAVLARTWRSSDRELGTGGRG